MGQGRVRDGSKGEGKRGNGEEGVRKGAREREAVV
jgi:hypothetical protein